MNDCSPPVKPNSSPTSAWALGAMSISAPTAQAIAVTIVLLICRRSLFLLLDLEAEGRGSRIGPAGADRLDRKGVLAFLHLVGLRRGAGRERSLVELALEGRAGDVGAEAEFDLRLLLLGLDRFLRVARDRRIRERRRRFRRGRD